MQLLGLPMLLLTVRLCKAMQHSQHSQHCQTSSAPTLRRWQKKTPNQSQWRRILNPLGARGAAASTRGGGKRKLQHVSVGTLYDDAFPELAYTTDDQQMAYSPELQVSIKHRLLRVVQKWDDAIHNCVCGNKPDFPATVTFEEKSGSVIHSYDHNQADGSVKLQTMVQIAHVELPSNTTSGCQSGWKVVKVCCQPAAWCVSCTRCCARCLRNVT